MDFIKKNKFTVLAVFFFVLFFILLVGAKNLFMPNTRIANYGNRLDGVEAISDDTQKNIISKYEENSNVKTAKLSINGKILSVTLTVNDDLSLKDAKGLTSILLDNIDDNIKSKYDLEIFISKEDKAKNNFPIIGYKHVKNDSFSWSRDRQITTSSEGEK